MSRVAEDGCRNQAITQVCAFSSPLLGIIEREKSRVDLAELAKRRLALSPDSGHFERNISSVDFHKGVWQNFELSRTIYRLHHTWALGSDSDDLTFGIAPALDYLAANKTLLRVRRMGIQVCCAHDCGLLND